MTELNAELQPIFEAVKPLIKATKVETFHNTVKFYLTGGKIIKIQLKPVNKE